nr:hypothetical protein [Tanacetum cinerariifolium]
MENLNEVRVKELRSDKRTEFKNHKLEEFCDEKGISHNFSFLCTPEQNDVAERRNKTLIEAARFMLNNAKLPKKIWGEAVNTACYTQNISIIVKRHGKTSYDVFRGRSSDISYFYAFGCPVHNHNHMDHLGKFYEKDDDGFFLGYSLVAKAFRVFNIKRQEMEETIHVTFSEDDEAISQSNTEGDAINFNENRSFPDDEFLESRSEVSVTFEYSHEFTEADNHPSLHEPDQTESADHLKPVEPQNNVIIEPISNVQPTPTISPSVEVILQTLVPQDRRPKEKQIELVNIIGEPLAALEEEGWIIAMQEELNQFEKNKVWTLVPKPHAIRIFLAYAAYMGFMVYQMDAKSAFFNEKISEEVYVQQPYGFESSEFHNHVCKLDKALYGLNQAPGACEMPYASFKQFGHDESGVSVNETLFRGMIGSLMYLTASRHDIQFFTCLCARYQANPKESHLVAVKRIFKYLKGTPNHGLWYPKGSGFDLKAYSNSDYAGCNLDRKSTSGCCQILGGKSFGIQQRLKKRSRPSPSHFHGVINPYRFTQDEFISAIGLPICKEFVPLPPKETVRARLATLGLFEKDKPTLSSTVLVNSSPLKMKYFTSIWKLLMQYIVKCLGGMQGSHDQMNLNQQTIAYCPIWGLEIDIGAIIFSDLIHKLQNGKKNRELNIFYTRRNPRGDIEASQLSDLQNLVREVVLSDQRDSWIWSPDISKGYTV